MTLKNQDPTSVEHEIHEALHFLVRVQSPESMTSRIHRSLETAASNHLRRNNRTLWMGAAGLVAGAIVVAALAIPYARETGQSPASETIDVTTASRPRPAAGSSTAIMTAPVSVSISHHNELAAAHSRALRHRQAHMQYRHAANLFDYPPTQQEKLLVRFVQTASPEELQTMNPEYQARMEAKQEAEFTAYVNSGNNSDTSSAAASPAQQNSTTE